MSDLLRKYIRALLLTESIDSKILSQFNKLVGMDALVDISKIGSGKIDIEVRRYDTGPQWNHHFGNVYATHGGAAGPCNNALIVGGPTMSGSGTWAKEGIGPLLYDILMEATYYIGKDGLGPDYESVSDDAYALWNYYLNNRSDITVKQRDITQNPRTPDPADDCTEDGGYRAAAKRFPGGAPAAYGAEPSYPAWDEEKEHPHNPEENFSPEFIEYWFDPANPLSKTYHKNGTPLIEKLRQEKRLTPGGAKTIGMPYNQEEMQEVWDGSWGKAYPSDHEKIPWISGIWRNLYSFDQTLLKELNPDAPWQYWAKY
jgi:hypothetical protein